MDTMIPVCLCLVLSCLVLSFYLSIYLYLGRVEVFVGRKGLRKTGVEALVRGVGELAGLREQGKDAVVLLLDQIAHHLVVEVLDWRP